MGNTPCQLRTNTHVTPEVATLINTELIYLIGSVTNKVCVDVELKPLVDKVNFWQFSNRYFLRPCLKAKLPAASVQSAKHGTVLKLMLTDTTNISSVSLHSHGAKLKQCQLVIQLTTTRYNR